VTFFAFVGAMAVAGVPGDIDRWKASPRTPIFGMLYFTVLGLLELKGFYQLPKVRRIAAQVRAAFQNSRRP
jgi:hypothetical protein